MHRAVFILLAALSCTLFAAEEPSPSIEPFTAKEIAQGFSDRVVFAKPRAARRAESDREEKREGRRVRRHWDRFDGLRLIELREGETVAQARERLMATGRYEFVHPDTIRHATAVPNDSSFGRQWGLANNGANNGIAGADIGATSAWDLRTDASNAIVAVIDSGVRLDHPDIVANLWRNPREIPGNGIDDDRNGYIDDVHGINAIARNGNPADDLGHGTHVAGIIGATGNNGTGITGVAWRVQIMALKFLRGGTGLGLTSDAITCIDYAIANGAHIVNASYGAASGSITAFDPAEFAAVRRLRDAGIIFVAAAGNEGADLDLLPHYPASFRLENMVAVGNSTNRDDLPVGTNFGSGAVELFAPGSDIFSLALDSSLYVSRSGTSMAAPHVTGALALLTAQFPNDNYRQLINRVLRTVDQPATLAGKSQTNGRLNLDRALRSTDNRPFNDDFATRARVTGTNLAIRAVNTGATTENGEPAIAGQSGGATLWWEWRAPTAGLVRMTTTGSSYDTLLGVFTGDALGAITPVASNDNDGASATSRLEFSTVAGTTYQIVVAGKGAATGLTLVDLGSIPANDAFAGAQVIEGRSALVSGTNAQATLEAGEPQIRGRTGGKSLWYRWTAPATGRFQFSLVSEGFDPLLAVYTGTTLGTLRLAGASDDADSEAGGASTYTTAIVTVDATTGTTYYIQADGAARAGVPPITARFSLTLNDSSWTGVTGGSVTNAPVIGPDGAVYVASNDGLLHAFNADGTRRWPALTLNAQMDTSAAALAADGTLYIATGPSFTSANGSKLHAFNSATGAKKWEILVGTSGNANNAVAIGADGTLFVHSDSGRLHAFRDNQTSVTERWAANVPGESYASVAIAPDGTIYLGTDDPGDNHRLYAINAGDGSVKWTFAADNPIYTTAAIDAAGNIYFGTLSSGRLYSVTPAGARRWVYAGASLGTSSSPALSPDGATVYFAGYDGLLHAVNTTTGGVRWTYRLGAEVRASSPAVDANGVVYIGCYDGLVHAIDGDGRLVRTFATGSLIRSSPGIGGRTLAFGSNDGNVYAFDLGVGVAVGNAWPQYRQNARRTGQRFTPALTVVTQPQSQVAVLGQSLSLSVIASGDGPITYQWRKDGVDIVGATTPVITVGTVTPAAAGRYTVAVISPTSSIMSTPADVTVEAANPGRLINLSVRTTAGTGDQMLAVGFVLSGASAKPMLLRAIGPSLTGFGVTGVLADPRLQLFSSAGQLAFNDNWAAPTAGTATEVATVFSQVGAFTLPLNSLDAAILRSMPVGAYSAQISGAAGAGIALAEIYDAEPLSGARLINVSARAQVGTGAGVLIAGFTISGNLPRQILIRGIGPTLGSAFGVGGVLANPRLDLYRGNTIVGSNDDWGGSATLGAAFAQVGAFSLPNASRDAALLLHLAPGSYTAQVSGVGGTTGVALVEVYELQ
ncbi:MAG: S8 family serine peptidase [Opitutaceae bacterium]|nr:S8 family serine peptidase [Opitutaceae bacterium]